MAAFKGIWTQEFWRCMGAEFFAMLLFVLLSLGSTISWTVEDNAHPPDLVLISLCFGLSISTMVQCFGHISGAHVNPAVTAAMVVTRKLSLAKALFYLTAQCVGAIVGAAILYSITPTSVRGGMGVTTVRAGVMAGVVAGAEESVICSPDQETEPCLGYPPHVMNPLITASQVDLADPLLML